MSAWQPIETAPKDGTDILLYEKWGIPFVGHWFEHPRLAGWTAEKQHLNTDGDANVIDYFEQKYVTHWMPIPPLPDAP